jgi:hypothetical protein
LNVEPPDGVLAAAEIENGSQHFSPFCCLSLRLARRPLAIAVAIAYPL